MRIIVIWYEHDSNQYCYNRLILENSIKKLPKWELWIGKQIIKVGHANDAMITQSLDTNLISTRKPDKKAYNTQRNYGLTWFRKAEKDYYNNLEHENVIDNKTFWKSVKSIFSEKGSTHNKITLVEQDLILDKNDNVAEVLNNFFTNVV